MCPVGNGWATRDLAGTGLIDPDLARDLAQAATRNPCSTWCGTVTDSQGHAVGHGCARPAPPGSTVGAAVHDRTHSLPCVRRR